MRKPLIVRGARQVGKTYIVQTFLDQFFPHSVTINFEASPQYAACFDTLDPRAILRSIGLIVRQDIVPGRSALFLDEIQQCPKALQALRYFKENLPELHVIAAGSLLEFAMEDQLFSFPVGRIQFARLYPLSFEEFLDGTGDEALRSALSSFDWDHPPPMAVHQHLLNRLQDYFMIGGMPSAITTYLKTQSLLEVQYEQKAILDTYENDFTKYAPKTCHIHMKKIFQKIPQIIGEHVKYSRINPELPNPAREMKKGFTLLQQAGLIHPIMATSAGGIPLMSGLKETIFKVLFLDIGLVEQKMGITSTTSGLMTGSLAEQFVGQELLAREDPRLDTPLFFWAPDTGAAEVDYLLVNDNKIIPVEVKAGKWGSLKSLHRFMSEKKAAVGIKISQQPLEKTENILSIPLYLTAHLRRLLA